MKMGIGKEPTKQVVRDQLHVMFKIPSYGSSSQIKSFRDQPKTSRAQKGKSLVKMMLEEKIEHPSQKYIVSNSFERIDDNRQIKPSTSIKKIKIFKRTAQLLNEQMHSNISGVATCNVSNQINIKNRIFQNHYLTPRQCTKMDRKEHRTQDFRHLLPIPKLVVNKQ